MDILDNACWDLARFVWPEGGKSGARLAPAQTGGGVSARCTPGCQADLPAWLQLSA